MALQVVYPANINNDDLKKMGYAYRLQELLRVEHNQKGQDYLSGIITEQEWQDYQDNVFFPKSNAITVAIVNLKNSFKVSQNFNPNLETDFETV